MRRDLAGRIHHHNNKHCQKLEETPTPPTKQHGSHARRGRRSAQGSGGMLEGVRKTSEELQGSTEHPKERRDLSIKEGLSACSPAQDFASCSPQASKSAAWLRISEHGMGFRASITEFVMVQPEPKHPDSLAA